MKTNNQRPSPVQEYLGAGKNNQKQSPTQRYLGNGAKANITLNTTDGKTLAVEAASAEDLKGGAAFIVDAQGNQTKAPDGVYPTPTSSITIHDGIVTEVSGVVKPRLKRALALQVMSSKPEPKLKRQPGQKSPAEKYFES
jgi:hypothetical protein